MENPDKIKDLACLIAESFIERNKKQYEIIKSFYGGYSIDQFFIWAPDRMVRMQNDATSLYYTTALSRFHSRT